MKVTEMGNLANCISFDIADVVRQKISDLEAKFEFDWYSPESKDRVLELVKAEIKARLPEVGFVIEATKDEVSGLPFNAFAQPVTLAKKGVTNVCLSKPLTLEEAIAHCNEVADKNPTSCGNEHRQLAKWLTELQKFRAAYDESFANSAFPKPDMEENGESEKRNCERFDNFDTAKAEFIKSHPEYKSPMCGVDEYYEALGKWLYEALAKFREEYNGGATA